MRSGARGFGETASQISDDECQGGGICPSCRLAVNKDTGRLKWCMGGNDIWRTRIRYMLLIPAVILPIAIIIIALSKSTVIGKLSMRSSHAQSTNAATAGKTDSDSSHPSTDPPPAYRPSFTPTVQNDIGQSEVAERALHPDVQTSFLPVESLIAPPHSLQRNRRDTSQRDGEAAAAAAWRRWRRATIGDSTSNNRPAATADGAAPAKASLLQELQVNFSRRPSTQQQQLQEHHQEEKLRSRSRRNGLGSAAVAQPADDDCCDENNDDDEDEDDEEDDNEDDEDSDSENDSGEQVDDSDEEDASEDDEDDNLSLTSSEEIRRRQREDAHPMKRDKDEESLNFWEGNWKADFIRKSQAQLMLRYMDRTAEPCQDFYQYACGNWQKYNPIPRDKSGFDTFEKLRESLDLVLKQLLEEPANDESSAIVKAKNLFRSCMNDEILKQRRERPLLELLEKLGGWPMLRPDWDPKGFDWLMLTAKLRLYNNYVLISEWVGPDTENSDQYIIQFDQTTLGLPTKDYFLQPVNSIYLMAYKNYIITVATLLGASYGSASLQAEELIQFETQLANITISPNERHNVSQLYKRMTLDELHNQIPQIDWHRYLSVVMARSVNFTEPVVLFTMKYLQDLVKLLSRTPSRTVANYLFWRFVRHRVNQLDDRFQDAKQKFYHVLLGREKSPPRWKSCVEQVNSNMGMAVGSIFVRKYFDEKSKNDTLSMTREIQQAFRELLNNSSWLDPSTKRLAAEKVEAMHLRIGYPDFILRSADLDDRYKHVSIHPDRFFENTLNILLHLTRVGQDRLGEPVNKTLWNAAPAIVNAFYSRNNNQIVFPAGILQPPFYHRYFPRSLNYGGIGVVIGHEITHGFDDNGRLFDKNGNFHRWWSKESIEEFDHRASCLIDQYGKYVVREVSMPIDGINTQGENISDNGGIKQAFRAYEKWLLENGEANERLPGLEESGRQLFFLNFAQVWCGSMRPEAMRNKLKTAVHAPGRYRVIGTLSNSKDFAEVFNCPLGSPMNPVKKCLVW